MLSFQGYLQALDIEDTESALRALLGCAHSVDDRAVKMLLLPAQIQTMCGDAELNRHSRDARGCNSVARRCRKQLQ